MTAITAALHRAAALLTRREEMEARRIESGDDTAWPAYLETVQALARLAPAIAPGANGRLLTTAELAEALNVSTRTIRRRKQKGQLAPAQQLGKRLLRWKSA